MKKSISFLVAVMLFAWCSAQSALETSVRHDGKDVPAFTINFTQNKDVVSAALAQRLKESNVKTEKVSGYVAVRNQTFSEIYSQPVDFFVKVSEQGRKDNRTVEVLCFAVSPNITIPQNELNLNVRHFLENFYNYAVKYEAQQKMTGEEKNLKKAQKNQEKAVSAVASLDKDIASTQAKISKKEQEIARYEAKIEKLRNEISALQSKMGKSKEKKIQAEEKVNQANSAVRSSEDEVERYRQQVSPGQTE